MYKISTFSHGRFISRKYWSLSVVSASFVSIGVPWEVQRSGPRCEREGGRAVDSHHWWVRSTSTSTTLKISQQTNNKSQSVGVVISFYIRLREESFCVWLAALVVLSVESLRVVCCRFTSSKQVRATQPTLRFLSAIDTNHSFALLLIVLEEWVMQILMLLPIQRQ